MEHLDDVDAIIDSPSTSSSLAVNSIRTFVARICATMLMAATGIVIAKYLGPAGKGVYSGLLLLVSLVMVAPGGIASAVTYSLTRQRKRLSDLVPALLVLLVAITALASIGAIAWALSHHWSVPLLLFMAAIPPSTVLAWQGGLYIGLGRLGNLNVQSAALAAATFAAVVVALMVFHGGPNTVLGAWVICLYGAATVVALHVLRLSHASSQAPLAATLRGLLRFGGQSMLNSLLGMLNYRVDSLILIAMLGTAPFGIYSIAVNFGEGLFWISRPLATASSRDIGMRGLASSAAMTAKLIRVCTATVIGVAVIAEIIGPWVIDHIFGVRFQAAAAPLRILLPGIVVFSTAGVFASFFILQLGKPMIVAGVNTIMIVLQATACYMLVPHFGLRGAAVASSATYAMGAILNTIWFCSASGMKPRDVWVLRISDVRTVLLAGGKAWEDRARRRSPNNRQPRMPSPL